MKDILETMEKLGVICRDNGRAFILWSTKTEKTLLYIPKTDTEAEQKIIDFCAKYIKRNGRRLKK